MWRRMAAASCSSSAAWRATCRRVCCSLRVYTEAERELLGDECVGFLCFLESAGVLPPALREMVIDRACAVGAGGMDLEEFKIIILMVFWSLGEEPDALILDELFVAPEDRLIH